MQLQFLQLSATPDSEKYAKSQEKEGRKRNNRGKAEKLGKKRQKLASFFHFAPPDRLGWLRYCLSLSMLRQGSVRWLWVEIVCHSPWNGTLCPLMKRKYLKRTWKNAYVRDFLCMNCDCSWHFIFCIFSAVHGHVYFIWIFQIGICTWYFKNLFVGNIWKRYKQRGLLLLSLVYHQWQCLCYGTNPGGGHSCISVVHMHDQRFSRHTLRPKKWLFGCPLQLFLRRGRRADFFFFFLRFFFPNQSQS